LPPAYIVLLTGTANEKGPISGASSQLGGAGIEPATHGFSVQKNNAKTPVTTADFARQADACTDFVTSSRPDQRVASRQMTLAEWLDVCPVTIPDVLRAGMMAMLGGDGSGKTGRKPAG
jgi:hypothetical protein